MIKKISVVMGLASQLCLTAQAQHHWQDSNYIADSFYQIALENEHHQGDGRLHKWNNTIFYQITDKTFDQALHQQLVDMQLKHLSQITGLKVLPAQNKKQANLSITFSSETTLANDLRTELNVTDPKLRQQLLYRSVCFATIAPFPNGNIKRAKVLIPVDRARSQGKLLSCIVEELTQVLGLPNDTEQVYPSVFNDKSVNSFLSGLDYVLLKLLYQPKLLSGMTKKQLKQIVPEIIRSQQFYSEIKAAEKKVRQGSLEQLLYPS